MLLTESNCCDNGVQVLLTECNCCDNGVQVLLTECNCCDNGVQVLLTECADGCSATPCASLWPVRIPVVDAPPCFITSSLSLFGHGVYSDNCWTYVMLNLWGVCFFVWRSAKPRVMNYKSSGIFPKSRPKIAPNVEKQHKKSV